VDLKQRSSDSESMYWRIISGSILILMTTAVAVAQPSDRDSLIELPRQLEEMREQMDKLQKRIFELESEVQSMKAGKSKSVATHAPAPEGKGVLTRAILSEPDGSVISGEATAFHYKGLTLTPGGFLEGTMLVRSRNENADIANSYSAVPLNGSSNAKLSEFRGSARNSELSLLFRGTAGTSALRGYIETDFLGAAPTANYVESSSWTPRLRQLWFELDRPSGWSITVGQMWSLLTTNKEGLATLSELRPPGEDGQFVVGFTWARQRAFRITRNFNNKVWTAFALESPETTYSAAYVPANLMGLNTSQNAATGVNLLPFLANYSNGLSTSLAPDLLAKAVFEPGWGHFEFKGLGRFFRDRAASTTNTNGRTNITMGYGVGFAAQMLFAGKKLEFSMEGLLGHGVGRYGSSALPDATIDPSTGELSPLREARIMAGLVYHRNSRLDLYAYGGDEYVGRRPFVAPTGGPAGYGSPLVSYTGCMNEVALNACSGVNRNVYEATAGYWYRIYRGAFGRIEQGNQVAYIRRNLWSGIGTAPQGSDIVIYTTLRFYLP